MFSLRRNALFILASLVFLGALAGILVQKLPISLYPHSSKPSIRVTTVFDMELLSFKKIIGEDMEHALRSIDNADRVEASYYPNRATFDVTFDWGGDTQRAYQDVSRVSALYQSLLPQNTPAMRVTFYDAGLEFYVVVKSKKIDVEVLGNLIKRKLEPSLNDIKGISGVRVSQINKKEASIKINPYSLVAHHLTMKDVIAPIEQARFNFSLGTIQGDKNNAASAVLYLNEVDSIDRLRNLPLVKADGRYVRLADVAEVTLQVMPQDRAYFIDDEHVIAITAWPFPHANLYDIAVEFEARLSAEVAGIGEVIVINSPIKYMRDSLMQMLLAVLIGMVFAGLSVLFVFRSMRLGMVVILMMPMSIVLAIVMVSLFDVGINIVSIGAVGIAIGMVVDSGVFVVDNIRSRLSGMAGADRHAIQQQLVLAVRESSSSVIFTTISSIVVFLPLVFTQPIVKALISDFIIVVIFLLLAASLISLLVVPSLLLFMTTMSSDCDWLTGGVKAQRENSSTLLSALLGQLLSRRWLWLPFLGGFIALFGFSIHLLVNDIRKEIVAQPLPEIIDIGLSFTSSDLPYAVRLEYVEDVKAIVKKHFNDRVRFVFVDMATELAYVSLHLKDSRGVDDLIAGLSKRIVETKGYTVDISPWVSASVKVEDIPNIRLMVSADNHEASVNQLGSISRFLQQQAGVLRLRANPRGSTTQYVYISLKDESISFLPDNVDYDDIKLQVQQSARYATKPIFLYDMRTRIGELPLSVQLGKQRSHNAVELSQIPISIGSEIFNLGQLADLRYENIYSTYYSRNAENTYMAEIWLADDIKNPVAFVRDLLKQLPGIDLQHVSVVDTSAEVGQNTQSLVLAIYLSFFLVLLVLIFDLHYLSWVFVAFASIPMGITGAILTLSAADSTLSINSMLGLIMLAGLSVNNAIIILHGFRTLPAQAQSMPRLDRVIMAVQSRLRSIVITSVSTICGMLPLALGLGNSGPIIQPLGLVVCGGIVSVLLFSVTLIPLLLYLVTNDKREP